LADWSSNSLSHNGSRVRTASSSPPHSIQVRLQHDASGSYFGCIVGRVANRISQASFRLPTGPVVSLEANNPPHTLHGGSQHWGKREWEVERTPDSQTVCFTLQYASFLCCLHVLFTDKPDHTMRDAYRITLCTSPLPSNQIDGRVKSQQQYHHGITPHDVVCTPHQQRSHRVTSHLLCVYCNAHPSLVTLCAQHS
jgi:hypothetical protein